MTAKIDHSQGIASGCYRLFCQSLRPLHIVGCCRLVFLVLFLSIPVSLANAQGDDVFSVSGIKVDVTDKTAAQARTKALDEGARKAYRRLMEILLLSSEYEKMPFPDSRELDSYIKDFSVEAEKTSNIRYLATLTYRFRKKEIRQLLGDYGLAFAETRSKPVLIIAAYQTAGALLLWDDPNPWRDVWLSRPVQQSLVPLIFPRGDLADVAALGVEQAIDGDRQRLKAIAGRYGAGDSIVVFAQDALDSNTGRPGLNVYISRFGDGPAQPPELLSFVNNQNETQKQLMRRASDKVLLRIEDQWKQSNLLQFNELDILPVVVPVSSLKNWIEIQKQLGKIAVIRRTELVLLSKEEARINIHYSGNPKKLALALGQGDLQLTDEDGEWVLLPRE